MLECFCPRQCLNQLIPSHLTTAQSWTSLPVTVTQWSSVRPQQNLCTNSSMQPYWEVCALSNTMKTLSNFSPACIFDFWQISDKENALKNLTQRTVGTTGDFCLPRPWNERTQRAHVTREKKTYMLSYDPVMETLTLCWGYWPCGKEIDSVMRMPTRW